MEKQYAIVTGGSRGLGEGMALRLAKLGYDLVINYVSEKSRVKAERVLEEAEKTYGTKGIAVQADVSDYEQCKHLVETAVTTFGEQIGVLVNNAGIANGKSFLELQPEEYRRLINVNLVSYLNVTHLVIPYMVKNRGGCIVNTASIGGLMGVVNQVDYCAAKSGVIGFTRALAMEVGGYGIRVNAIAPGMIWTDMLKGSNQEEVAALKQAIPLGEIGEVDDIAGCMEYLVTAKYVTGQTVSPNGGIIMP